MSCGRPVLAVVMAGCSGHDQRGKGGRDMNTRLSLRTWEGEGR
jgi:hypothetical protein